MCKEQRDANGSMIFDGKVNGKVVKDEFRGLLKLIKAEQNSTQFRSGQDDEGPLRND